MINYSQIAVRAISRDIALSHRSVLTVGLVLIPLLLVVISSIPTFLACSFTTAGRQHLMERVTQMIEWTRVILTAGQQDPQT